MKNEIKKLAMNMPRIDTHSHLVLDANNWIELHDGDPCLINQEDMWLLDYHPRTWTIAMWLKSTDSNDGWKSMLAQSGNWRFDIGYNVVGWHHAHCGEVRAPESMINDGQWHH